MKANIRNYKIVDLEKSVEHLEEEARMILPGIQVLFGFQLIAVFNQRFTELSQTDKICHYIALICIAISVICILVPAAYHRQAESHMISNYFCHMGNRMLTFSLFPFSIGTSLDLYVITDTIFDNQTLALATGIGVFILFMLAWFAFPQYRKYKIRHLRAITSIKQRSHLE